MKSTTTAREFYFKTNNKLFDLGISKDSFIAPKITDSQIPVGDNAYSAYESFTG